MRKPCGLELQSRVVNPEVVVKLVRSGAQQIIRGTARHGHYQMRGHRRLRDAHRPDVQIVHVGHPGQSHRAGVRRVDADHPADGGVVVVAIADVVGFLAFLGRAILLLL